MRDLTEKKWKKGGESPRPGAEAKQTETGASPEFKFVITSLDSSPGIRDGNIDKEEFERLSSPRSEDGEKSEVSPCAEEESEVGPELSREELSLLTMLMYRERSEREAELRALVQGKMKERMVALESQLTEYEALVSGGAVQTVVIPPPAPALPEALGATARTASAKNEDGELRDSSQSTMCFTGDQYTCAQAHTHKTSFLLASRPLSSHV